MQLTKCRGVECIEVNHASHPNSQASGIQGLPNFGGSPVFMPTPFNAEQMNIAFVFTLAGHRASQLRGFPSIYAYTL